RPLAGVLVRRASGSPCRETMSVGVLKGLVLLPLAPVRGVVWLAERLAEQAEHELYDEASIRRQLDELQDARDLDEIPEETYQEAEAQLVERLMEARRRGEPWG